MKVETFVCFEWPFVATRGLEWEKDGMRETETAGLLKIRVVHLLSDCVSCSI